MFVTTTRGWDRDPRLTLRRCHVGITAIRDDDRQVWAFLPWAADEAVAIYRGIGGTPSKVYDLYSEERRRLAIKTAG